MNQVIKPMLACNKPVALEDIRHWPIAVQPKLDGVRAISRLDGLWSRTGKLLPNGILQARHTAWRRDHIHDYMILDGELTLDDPNITPTFGYNEVQSCVMSKSDTQADDLVYGIFDVIMPEAIFHDRMMALSQLSCIPYRFSKVVHTNECPTIDEAREYVEQYDEMGYEGTIIRRMDGLYKHGRSTRREELLLKIVTWERTEGQVVGVKQLVRDSGELAPMVGALQLTDGLGIRFDCGSGFTNEEREDMWKDPPIGRTAVVKYKPHGTKDAPRHPIFVGWRDAEMDT